MMTFVLRKKHLFLTGEGKDDHMRYFEDDKSLKEKYENDDSRMRGLPGTIE